MHLKHYYFFIYTLFLSTILLTQCQVEEGVKSIYPNDGMSVETNTPILSWMPVQSDWQEVWINGIKMDSIGADLNSYIPFSLSYGVNKWQIVSVKGDQRIFGTLASFNVEDNPLSKLPQNAQLLREGWKMESSANVELSGKELSSQKVEEQGWYSTSIPATALSVLVRNGVYPNPYIAKNNMLIPDLNDVFNEKHDLLKYSHIKGQNPWVNPYWYVKSFVVDSYQKNQKVWLNFNELNYRAELWLNGLLLADSSQMVGMERRFRFDVTELINNDSENHLAVAIFPVDIPGEPAVPPLEPFGDPGVNMGDGQIGKNYTKWDAIGWDWQPAIRDRDMGITEDIFLSFTDAVELTDVYITSDPNLPKADFADMIISANLVNYSPESKNGALTGQIIFASDTIEFSVPFNLMPDENKALLLDKHTVKELRISNPKLWWPSGYGEPNLYKVKLTAQTEEGDFSTEEENHGIRKIDSRVEGSRIFSINGKDIFLKGGNWVIDMTLNWTATRYEEEILLSKNANLNILRVWGPTGVPPKAFYDAADKHGILLWQDFLNDYWGTFRNTPGYQPDEELYKTISTGIVKRYRNHPSLIIWCGGNEGVNPREDLLVNQVLANYDNRSHRFYLKTSDGHGLHGGGPYHSIRPEEFFTHSKLYGFSSEIGVSGIPVVESVKRFVPAMGLDAELEHFPVDGTWGYHDAANFAGEDLRKFTALDNIIRIDYGAPKTKDLKGAENYLAKAQFQNYAAYQAAISSIGIQMWDNSTGMLLWKSNSSWPSLVWQLYDWYQQAHAGYYGAKKAFAPFNIQFNRATAELFVVNAQYQEYENIDLSARLYDANMNLLWEEEKTTNIGQAAVLSSKIVVPKPEGLVFLKISAKNNLGDIMADNFYWLHEENDFSGLSEIASANLRTNFYPVEEGKEGQYRVAIENNGDTPALLIRMMLVDKQSGHEILPALWSDNFVSLLPGEKKELFVELPRGKYANEVELSVSAFN